jgi:hypothetical protein
MRVVCSIPLQVSEGGGQRREGFPGPRTNVLVTKLSGQAHGNRHGQPFFGLHLAHGTRDWFVWVSFWGAYFINPPMHRLKMHSAGLQ